MHHFCELTWYRISSMSKTILPRASSISQKDLRLSRHHTVNAHFSWVRVLLYTCILQAVECAFWVHGAGGSIAKLLKHARICKLGLIKTSKSIKVREICQKMISENYHRENNVWEICLKTLRPGNIPVGDAAISTAHHLQHRPLPFHFNRRCAYFTSIYWGKFHEAKSTNFFPQFVSHKPTI